MATIGRATAFATAAALVAAATIPSAARAAVTPDVPVTCGDVITRPGTYVLPEDCTGPGIRIAADDVTLYLGGHTIRHGSASGEGGIEIGPVEDAVVTEGRIEGFPVAVFVDRGRSPRIESVEARGGAGGIVGDMDNARIEDNRIEGSSQGIFVTGNDNMIRGNRIAGEGVAVMLQPGDRHSANGNTVEGNEVAGAIVGILLASCRDECRPGPASYNEVRSNVTDDGRVGIALESGASFNRVEHNRANGNAFVGISVERASAGNVLRSNVAWGNGTQDLLDGNAICDANEWIDNDYGTFTRHCTA